MFNNFQVQRYTPYPIYGKLFNEQAYFFCKWQMQIIHNA